VTVPLHELASVKCVEKRGANVLELKRVNAGGQSTTLQLLTNEVRRHTYIDTYIHENV